MKSNRNDEWGFVELLFEIGIEGGFELVGKAIMLLLESLG